MLCHNLLNKQFSNDALDGDVGVLAQRIDQFSFGRSPTYAEHQRRTIDDSVHFMRRFDVVGDYFRPIIAQTIEHVVQRSAVRCREDDHHPPKPQPSEKKGQYLQSEKRQQRGSYGKRIHARSAGESDSSRRPQTRRRRKAPNQLAMKDDRTGPDEADAADDLSRNTARIETQSVVAGDELIETVLRDDHHQRAAYRDEEVGSEPRILDPIFAVETDDRAADTRDTQTQNIDPRHGACSFIRTPIYSYFMPG